MSTVTSWYISELVIDNQPFNELVKYLERWYGIEITLADNLNIARKLSFKVKTEILQELLMAISNICPIKYKIDSKSVLISAKK
jgi:transmembrane sensor